VPQEIFDTVLLAADFLIVRGEESLARASLAGIPFLWQAYPLADGCHQAKVEGLLQVLAPHLMNISGREEILNAFRLLNADRAAGSSLPTGNSFLVVLNCLQELYYSYSSFSNAIEAAGDLTFLLLSFFTDFV
jgi:hypothetical protein